MYSVDIASRIKRWLTIDWNKKVTEPNKIE